jgi:protein ImuA
MPALAAADRLADLRRAVAALEGRPSADAFARGDPRPFEAALSFDIPALDARLGPAGGLAFGSLHEIVCDGTRDAAAVTGFASALLARLLARRDGRFVWITTAEARRETGPLHPPGLRLFGLDPARLVEVAAERPEEALWAFEEALASPGSAAVVAEIPGHPAVLDLTATRRLALRAAAGESGPGGFGLLLRVGGRPQTTAAATRWRVSAVPSRPLAGFRDGLGRPAFRLDLEKNRDGRLGRFDLEWDPHARRFGSLPAHSGRLSAEPADRSAAPAPGGRLLAFPSAGRA